MPSRSIFRTELNAIIQSLLKSELGETSFGFSKDLSKKVFSVELPLQVTHKESGFYFQIDFELDHYANPYYAVRTFPGDYQDIYHWDEVINRMGEWLDRVRTEISQPDPWLLLNQGSVLKDAIPVDSPHRNIDDYERLRIHEHLQIVREFLIVEAQPSSEQLQLIDERLLYLEGAAKRQSKQDWAHTAVGVMFTIAIGLAMAPDQANRLLQITGDFIRSIFVPLLK